MQEEPDNDIDDILSYYWDDSDSESGEKDSRDSNVKDNNDFNYIHGHITNLKKCLKQGESESSSSASPLTMLSEEVKSTAAI